MATLNSVQNTETISPKRCPLTALNARGRASGRSTDIRPSSFRGMHSLVQTRPDPHSITTLDKASLQHNNFTVPLVTSATTMGCDPRFLRNRMSETNKLYPNSEHQLRCKRDAAEKGAAMIPTTPGCSCKSPYKQTATEFLCTPPAKTVHNECYRKYPAIAAECYSGYDTSNKVTEEDDSAFPALHDREFHILHRNIPALRRSGVDTTTIRQHFYPDGGWGWIICSISFLVHILTSGLQLSYSMLLFYAVHHIHHPANIEWVGALSWSVSMIATPFVVTICRKKSTRLMAVIGGLVMSLGILFTSFATEFGQVVFSYGIFFAVGVAMVRESSLIMLGNYFKKRRKFVEMVAMSGEGVGMALFSVILKEGVGKVGWRLGLQLVAVIMSINFFMGMFYRSASLYHPQRRAIQHLKNQRKKMREKKVSTTLNNDAHSRSFLLDVSPLRSAVVKIIVLTAGVASLGIYAPIFSMSINAAKEGSDIQDLVLLQTFLGISMTLGVVVAGSILRSPLRIGSKLLSSQFATQVFISTISITILFLSFVVGYRSLCILSWIYGIGFGGYKYSIKILALEHVKMKHFTKVWGLMKGAESIPILISIPLTTFLNEYSLKYGRAGYYICSAAAAIAGITVFFLSYTQTYPASRNCQGNSRTVNARTPLPSCTSPGDFIYGWRHTAPDSAHNSCINLNQAHLEYPIYDTARNTTSCTHCFGAATAGDARIGRRLQKSLSFIHCPGSNGCQWICDCRTGQDSCKPLHGSRTLVCTCNSGCQCNLGFKSRSVPEGLSLISQCTCPEVGPKEMRYLPESSYPCAGTCPRWKAATSFSPMSNHRQFSQPFLSKPFHLVEQITTSV